MELSDPSFSENPALGITNAYIPREYVEAVAAVAHTVPAVALEHSGTHHHVAAPHAVNVKYFS